MATAAELQVRDKIFHRGAIGSIRLRRERWGYHSSTERRDVDDRRCNCCRLRPRRARPPSSFEPWSQTSLAGSRRVPVRDLGRPRLAHGGDRATISHDACHAADAQTDDSGRLCRSGQFGAIPG